jgi:xylan 1,4-beta-xylosidase
MCSLKAFAALALAVAATQAHPQAGAPWVEFSRFHYDGRNPSLPTRPLTPGEYRNPILPGFYPDPSIVRVGADFYLVNSTFAWSPGVPIFHSRDLINWQQIGFVLNRPSQLKLDRLQVSQGVFAPALRYHDGTFYMITTLVGGVGNFYVTARNPAGPWSDPVLLPEIDGIDPSFFFDDDGKAWIVHNGLPPGGKPLYDGHRAIWLFPFDLAAGRVAGPSRVLVNGGTDISKKPSWIEGPHLYHHDGFYFLIAAEGGTSSNHSEVVFRSRTLDGKFEPWSKNPILTQRDLDPHRANPIADTGHADMVEDATGKWWAVFLGVQPYADNLFNTGRETFLLPVNWQDGWPSILPAGKTVPRVGKIAASRASEQRQSEWEDPFSETALRPEWQMLRTPDPNWRSLNRTPGTLSLEARVDDLTSRGQPSFLARRQQQTDFNASVTLNLRRCPKDVDAGLAAFQNEHAFYFFGVSTPAAHGAELFVEQGGGTMADPSVQHLKRIDLAAGAKQITLRISGKAGSISFFYRLDDGDWKPLLEDQDATILSTEKAGGFVGTMLGPMARIYRP